VWAAGIVQPIWMIVEIVRRRGGPAAWRALRWLVAGSMLMVYASYWFVIEPPQAHAFYVLAPLAFLLAAYCWTFIDSPRWRRVAAAVLFVNIAFHVGLAVAQLPELSLYKNRAPVADAVRLRQPEMFGHRRPFAIEGAPYVLSDPSRPYDAVRDMQVISASYTVERGPYVQWHVVVKNANPRVAFRDLLYITTYRDAAGRIVDERHEYIKDIFEPGGPRAISANDGWSTTPFAEASFRIAAAEALLPAHTAIGAETARTAEEGIGSDSLRSPRALR
jgi:hypothetical protein